MNDPLLVALGLVTVIAAVGVIASREVVHSALCLTVNLLGVGGLFLALQHQYLAVAQMLVYAGAVMVVFLFAVTTLTPVSGPRKLFAQQGLPALGIATGLMMMGGLAWGTQSSRLSEQLILPDGELIPASSFAEDLFGTYLLPFEGTAFILLTALIGAIILGGRQRTTEDG